MTGVTPAWMLEMVKSENGIVLWPSEILSQVAAPIENFDKVTQELGLKLIGMMLSNRGLGLAAPQIGESVQMFAMKLDSGQPMIVCNPHITLEGQEEAGVEGCLSMPGVTGHVFRNLEAVMVFQDISGVSHTVKMEGLEARIVQHEGDHLQGKMFFEKMPRQQRRRLQAIYEKLSRRRK